MTELLWDCPDCYPPCIYHDSPIHHEEREIHAAKRTLRRVGEGMIDQIVINYFLTTGQLS